MSISVKTKMDVLASFGRIFFRIGLLVILMPGAVLAEMSERVGDYRFIFTAIPSILFMDHPKNHPVRQMHGGVAGIPKYHLMLTIFNVKTGKRIKAASVTVKVNFESGRAYQKKLEPMLLNGVLNYGNYFNLNNSGSVKVEFKVKMNEATPPLKVVFHWSIT